MSEPMGDIWHRFVGVAQGGKFHPQELDRLKHVLKVWEGKDIEVCIRLDEGDRTLEQNKFLHVLATLISDETGESINRVKECAVEDSLGIARGTSQLTVGECSVLIDWMLDKCAFLNIPRPDPKHYEVMR